MPGIKEGLYTLFWVFLSIVIVGYTAKNLYWKKTLQLKYRAQTVQLIDPIWSHPNTTWLVIVGKGNRFEVVTKSLTIQEHLFGTIQSKKRIGRPVSKKPPATDAEEDGPSPKLNKRNPKQKM